ncbi:MAG: flagellar type III secretion system pore protein FliP [Armatimonadota bacterium]
MTEMVSVVRVIASCALVCAIAWWLGVWLKKLQPLQTKNNRTLRLLELLPLGSGKSLALVSCYNRKFLIAITPQSIQLIAEVGEPNTNEGKTCRSGFSRETNGDEGLTDEDLTLSQSGKTKTSELLRRFLPMLHLFVLIIAFVSLASSQSTTPNPQNQLSLMRESVQILMLLTLIALAPFLLAVMTCFTRIVIVLSLLRVAMGTPQTPPNPVIIGMAIFLTLFVMAPTLQDANEKGLKPFLQNEISLEQALTEGYKPFQKFMLRQVREKDIALFLRVAKLPNPKTPEDVPPYILIPAFILSEIRTGFEIGFLLSVPFLVVDLVVASVLMGMGMLMVPPMLISLPLKLLLFVLADGWHLLMRGLALSVR